MTYHVLSFPFTPSSTFAPQDPTVFMSWFWALRTAASQFFLSDEEGELETPIVDWGGVYLLANGKWWPISHGLLKTLGPPVESLFPKTLGPPCCRRYGASAFVVLGISHGICFFSCSIYSPSFCASFFCWKRMETPFKLFIVQMWKTRLASLSLQQWNKSRMRIAHNSKLHWRDSADPTGKGRKTFWGEKHPGWYHNNSRWAASIELETWRMWLHRQLNFFPFSFCFFHTSTHPNRTNPVQMPP